MIVSLVSIVVPVYNVEIYIKDCLESLKNQKFQEFEVLVIDDGSTDNSGVIAKEFCSNNNKFVYHKHENIGLGPTRNLGIELCKSEYICFVDSDDTVPSDMLENLFNKIDSDKLDVVCGEIIFTYEDESKDEIKINLNTVKDIDFTKTGMLEFFKNYYFINVYSHNAWDKIYRASILKKNNIRFGNNKEIFGEDELFQLELLNYAKKIGFIHHPVYYYLQRKGSIMNSYKPRLIERQLKMVDIIRSKVVAQNIDSYATVLPILVYEGLILEVINTVDNNRTFEEFSEKMNLIRENTDYSKQIINILKKKSHKLISFRGKKFFMLLIATLERYGLWNISNKFVYQFYKKRKNK